MRIYMKVYILQIKEKKYMKAKEENQIFAFQAMQIQYIAKS